MTTSQNGFSVPTTLAAQAALLTDIDTPGGPLRVRKGNVACVLQYVAIRYAAEVEPLHRGWCWGFAIRLIAGSTAVTNHASGTAEDFDAPEHPLGANPTASFTSKQLAAMRRIVADCGGVIRCGAFYTGRKDGMHWEINASAARVSALAAKIRAGKMPGQKGPAVPQVPVFRDFTKPQHIPGGGIMHLLYVEDGTTHLSWLYGVAHPHGRALVSGKGTPGDLVEFDPALYTARGKSYALVAGLGSATALVGADGAFHFVYPIDLDIPAKQGLRPQIAATHPITVTAVRARLWKDAA